MSHSCQPGPLWVKAALKTSQAGDLTKKEGFEELQLIFGFFGYSTSNNTTNPITQDWRHSYHRSGRGEVPSHQSKADYGTLGSNETIGYSVKTEFQINSPFFPLKIFYFFKSEMQI